MSTIIASNISDGTTSVPSTYVVNGSAKAWVNFNGTGTIAARDSMNVGSITDNGTGDYTVNFSSAFGAGDYSVGSYVVHGSGSGVHTICGDNTSGDPTSSSIRVRVKNQATSIFDPSMAGLNIMGDLA